MENSQTQQNISSLDFDLLRTHAIKKSREFLYTHPEHKLNIIERLRLAYFLFLYKHGYSVAAITHHKEFYGLDFYVNRHTLIPRPETELMVELAIEEIKKSKNQKIILVDVGTGSGCIPIAIAKQLTCHPEQSEGSSSNQLDPSVVSLSQNDNIKIFATDISRPVLCVARKNARIQNVSINFLHGNLLQPLFEKLPLPWGEGHGVRAVTLVITANLPYLTFEQFKNEPSIQREPRSALVAGNNGLALYEEFLKQTQSLCFVLRVSCYVFLEIDPSQTARITYLIKTYLPQAVVEIKPDLAGQDRVVKITCIPTER